MTLGRLTRTEKQFTELVKTSSNRIHSLSKCGNRRDNLMLGFHQSGEIGCSSSMGGDGRSVLASKWIHPWDLLSKSMVHVIEIAGVQEMRVLRRPLRAFMMDKRQRQELTRHDTLQDVRTLC